MKEQKKWAGVIYAITNRVNGMQYVGKTERVDFEVRWKQHVQLAHGESKQYIHRAMRKYGVEKFSFDVIQRCHTITTLNAAESRWINKLHTFAPNGYNLTVGGDGTSGFRYKQSKTTRIKMSHAQRRRFADEKLRAANIAAHRAPKFVASQSEDTKLLWTDKKWRKKQTVARAAEEFRHRQSKIASQMHTDPTTRAKWLAGIQSEACSDRHSKSGREHWADPVNYAKHLKAHQTKEFRAKKSDDTKAFWSTMTVDERKAHWHATHLNGNGGGKPTKASKARKAAKVARVAAAKKAVKKKK